MKRPGHHQMLGLSVGDKFFTFRTPKWKRIMSSLMWGKMKTIAWDTAFQIALRNCSKEAAGKTSIYVIWVKGQYLQSGTYILQKVFACLALGIFTNFYFKNFYGKIISAWVHILIYSKIDLQIFCFHLPPSEDPLESEFLKVEHFVIYISFPNK